MIPRLASLKDKLYGTSLLPVQATQKRSPVKKLVEKITKTKKK